MADLLARAQAGDGDAFGQLVDPYRRELEVYCYRFLGSAQDAEDALHSAACHACLFVPETSCKRGNRYLDRAVLVQTLSTDRVGYFER